MLIIKLSLQSKKKEVAAFLEGLKNVLEGEYFNLNDDLIIIRSSKRDDKRQFSTPYTLLELDYDAGDVAECLKELTAEEYSETLVDKDNVSPRLLFVFGKNINNKQVYIKLKLKENQIRQVLCVSFHYAEEKMRFPYGV